MVNFNLFFCSVLCVFMSNSFAAESTILGSLLFDQGAARLSFDETKAMIQPGASVEQINGSTGGIRRWTLEADGKFIASRVAATGGSRPVTGQGEWKLTENGQFCVQIEWRPSRGGPEQENWCRVLYKHDGAVFLEPIDLANTGDKKYGQISFKR